MPCGLAQVLMFSRMSRVNKNLPQAAVGQRRRPYKLIQGRKMFPVPFKIRILEESLVSRATVCHFAREAGGGARTTQL